MQLKLDIYPTGPNGKRSNHNKKEIADLKTLDLFSGIGGVRLGFERNGFETVFSNDFEPSCKLTSDLNFAKPSLRSKHNSSYWQGKKYYGFGPSAHSFDGVRIRRWNIANNALYIQSIQKNGVPYEEEALTQTQQLNEYIMTSLRTVEGLDLNYVKIKFGEAFSTKLTQQSAKFSSTKKVVIENLKIILTNEGKLFADGIAADLFF